MWLVLLPTELFTRLNMSNEAINNASVGFVGSTGIVHEAWLFIT